MSSKVLEPDDSLPVAPFAFRPVHPAEEENRAGAGEVQRAFQTRLAQLEQQCEQRIREAHTAGMREGEAAGRSRAAAELQPVIERLAHSIDDVAGMRPRLRKEIGRASCRERV
jgi:flagellar biosynthesis/type III secretory pathway protein FliH